MFGERSPANTAMVEMLKEHEMQMIFQGTDFVW